VTARRPEETWLEQTVVLSERRARVGEDASRPGLLGGRYLVGERLGEGAMAEVRAGRDTRLERPVAIKFLKDAFLDQPSARQRFEVEARSAARLLHPHAVSVFDTGEQDGVPYIVMERLPGTTLRDRVRSGPMSSGEVTELGRQTLAALSAAHALGLIHRDIKPANILATESGHWKVGDFGIAKSYDDRDRDDTRAGLVAGSPAYLAPERASGAPATPASDLFALGVVLFEALCGSRPATLTPVPSLTTACPGVDPALAGAVERSLAADPGQRFASAQDMAAAMASYGPPIPPPDPAWATTTMPIAASPYDTQSFDAVGSGLPDGGRPTRRRLRVGVALGAAVASTAFVLALALGGHTPPRAARTKPSVPTASSTTAPATTTTTPVSTTAGPAPAAPPVGAPAPAGPGGHKGGPPGHGHHG
jgi:serine/threonine protein kinase